MSVTITVAPDTVIGTNLLSLGMQDGNDKWTRIVDGLGKNPVATRDLIRGFNGKVYRIMDFDKNANPLLTPCSSWNNATNTGVWNWTNVDKFVDAVFAAGAEPMFVLGWAYYNASGTQSKIPNGMALDATTNLPSPSAWAAYCSEWVRHFRDVHVRPVRLYETMNEPWSYFGMTDYTKLGYYRDVINATYVAMRAVNPDIMLGWDGTNRKGALDWWLANGGANLDFISFHKYDGSAVSGRTGTCSNTAILNEILCETGGGTWTYVYPDPQLLDVAETWQIADSGSFYSPSNARAKYKSVRGVDLPVFQTEGNLSAASVYGTDLRTQQVIGGVWLAVNIRKCILSFAIDLNIYFTMSSDYGWEMNNSDADKKSWGFGMTNRDFDATQAPIDNVWFPYWVYTMFGANLRVGDAVVNSSTSDSVQTRVVAWRNTNLNIMVINRSTSNINVVLNGVTGTFNYTLVDGSLSSAGYTDPKQQKPLKGAYQAGQAFALNGYSVVLLQQPLTGVSLPFHDSFASLANWQIVNGTWGVG